MKKKRHFISFKLPRTKEVVNLRDEFKKKAEEEEFTMTDKIIEFLKKEVKTS